MKDVNMLRSTFTLEEQKRLNGNTSTITTFSGHTIIKNLVTCNTTDCNVVSYDIGRILTNEFI